MIKYLLIALLFLGTPAYADDACLELSMVAETVDSEHQSGIPKIAVQTSIKLARLKTRPMKVFVAALVNSAYSDERVENINKKEAVEEFAYALFLDCERLMKLHNSLK